METYSVKQIAEMLGTNPETVRRWIRSNQLKTIQVSRKTGNIVSAKELEHFMRSLFRFSFLLLSAFSTSAAH